jgi:hypothetical protein
MRSPLALWTPRKKIRNKMANEDGKMTWRKTWQNIQRKLTHKENRMRVWSSSEADQKLRKIVGQLSGEYGKAGYHAWGVGLNWKWGGHSQGPQYAAQWSDML